MKYNDLVLDPSQLQREWKVCDTPLWFACRRTGSPLQEYHHELLLVAWQAMSTKVLARRSVTEVDVDDGTYTKLNGV